MAVDNSDIATRAPLAPESAFLAAHSWLVDHQLGIWLIYNMSNSRDNVNAALRALSNDRRCLILEWLKHPTRHFRAQADGDLVEDGVCGVLIAEKLGVSQPTVSEHLKILSQAGFLRAKRVKQWTFYKRDEVRIAKLKQVIIERI
jgi:DNA-binding transcriptional ArsR family regulator